MHAANPAQLRITLHVPTENRRLFFHLQDHSYTLWLKVNNP